MSDEYLGNDDIKQDDEWSDADPTERRREEQQWLRSANPELTDPEIEAVYEGGETRLVIQVNDWLIRSLRDSLESGDYINLAPEYQRRVCWPITMRSKLIESLLMNVAIPPVVLYEVQFAKYEVMDGQQRLDTIRAFFSNEFALTGLSEWACVNGRRWSDLPPTIRDGLLRRTVTAVVVLRESAKSEEAAWALRRSVFERLNTGALILNAQEIRNCVYYGSFNALLHELARSALFTQVWGIPPKEKEEPRRVSARLLSNTTYRRMLDNEIVLRFFALRDKDAIRSSMKITLDDCMSVYGDADEGTIADLRREFELALSVAHDVYGPATFRLPAGLAGQKRERLSKVLYDAVMVGIHRTLQAHPARTRRARAKRIVANAAFIRERTQDLLGDPETYPVLTGRLNTREATLERLQLLTDVMRQAQDG